jgi:hypothetical protein
MTEAEFKKLRDLPGKRITGDMEFKKAKREDVMLVFDKVVVANDMNLPIQVNGAYHPGVPFASFNFLESGFGPVCRLEINRDIHYDAGRTHKHEYTDESGVKRAYCAERFIGLEHDVVAAWKELCGLANIVHDGELIVGSRK